MGVGTWTCLKVSLLRDRASHQREPIWLISFMALNRSPHPTRALDACIKVLLLALFASVDDA